MQALLSTRKGLFVMKKSGSAWKIAQHHFDGVKTSHASYLPKSKVVIVGLNHGHWGPKLHISRNKGKTLEEITPPKFPEGHKDTLKDFWCFTEDSQGRWYVGVEPAAIFHSDDQGKTWVLNQGVENMPEHDKWFGGGTDGTCMHSLIVHPENDNHLIGGISCAGVIESRDRGATWKYTNKGMKAEFLPNPDADVGQDPHKVTMAPSDPNVLWQQNHCGIYKSEDCGQNWINLSKSKGVQSKFGWGVVVDEEDPRIAYTVPALSDETRVPVKKRLIVQKTKDGGKTWKTLNKGLPKGLNFDIVYRNALALKEKTLMFGSTTGNLYHSGDRGASWKRFDVNLPPIYGVELFN